MIAGQTGWICLTLKLDDEAVTTPNAHHAVERPLKRSSMSWTILRAGFFAQNFTDAYRRDLDEHDRIWTSVRSPQTLAAQVCEATDRGRRFVADGPA